MGLFYIKLNHYRAVFWGFCSQVCSQAKPQWFFFVDSVEGWFWEILRDLPNIPYQINVGLSFEKPWEVCWQVSQKPTWEVCWLEKSIDRSLLTWEVYWQKSVDLRSLLTEVCWLFETRFKSTINRLEKTWEVCWLEKSVDLRSLLTWKVNRLEKSTDLRSLLTWEVCWLEKSTDLRSQQTWEVNRPRLEKSVDLRSLLTSFKSTINRLEKSVDKFLKSRNLSTDFSNASPVVVLHDWFSTGLILRDFGVALAGVFRFWRFFVLRSQVSKDSSIIV